jgi:hypothetical protein
MRRYKVKFAFSQYETIEARNKQEAKEKYIENMTKVMPGYGLDFDDECIRAIRIECI